MKRAFIWTPFAVVIALGATFAVNANAQGLSALEGSVEIDGSSTVAPISIRASTTFKDKCPKVSVQVSISGTGGGFKRFTKGETDISDASRPIKFKEMKQCDANGIKFIEIPVAYDGLTVAVAKGNTFVDVLTVDQLKKIFRASKADGGFSNAKNWSDVNSEWPSTPIKIFSPGTDSGTFDYFKEVIVGKDEGVSIREDMSVSENDNQLVQGIANTDGAVGFFGASYYFANQDKLKAVKIVNPETKEAVEVSAKNIESGKYAPFSRPLFIYVNAKAARRPEVKVFVNHYLKNAGELAKAVDYVGLPESVEKEAAAHFKRRKSGTHFWNKDGQKKEGSLTDLYTADNILKME